MNSNEENNTEYSGTRWLKSAYQAHHEACPLAVGDSVILHAHRGNLERLLGLPTGRACAISQAKAIIVEKAKNYYRVRNCSGQYVNMAFSDSKE